jgi:hypothetical protein
MFRSLLLTSALAGLVAPLSGAVAQTPGEQVQLVTPPQVEIRLNKEKLSLLQDVKIDVLVAVTDPRTTVAISQITVNGPSHAVEPLRVFTSESENSYYYFADPGKPAVKQFVQKVPRGWPSILAALGWQSSDTGSVKVDLSYAIYEKKNLLSSGTTSTTLTLNYTSPFWVLLLGIATGALLRIVWLATVKHVEQPVLSWFRTWLASFVSGVILLLTTQLTSTFELPVEIEVRDYIGAIVLGLIAHNLLLAVAENLGLRDAAVDPNLHVPRPNPGPQPDSTAGAAPPG